MEADWSEATRITIPGPTHNTPPSTLTTFAFDPSEELLWTGNEYVSRLQLMRMATFVPLLAFTRLLVA